MQKFRFINWNIEQPEAKLVATEKDPLEKEKCDHSNSGPTSTPARGRMAAARGRVAAARVAAAPTSCRLLSDR